MLLAVPLEEAVKTEPTMTPAGCQEAEPPTAVFPSTDNPEVGAELGDGDGLGDEDGLEVEELPIVQ